MNNPTKESTRLTERGDDFDWLDRTCYPFKSNYFDLSEGRVHYIDEGEGPPVVMLHGNPTWSFLYCHLIRGLSDDYRCIAPDLLGFGLSETPSAFPYRPADHARVVDQVIDALDLQDAVIVGHDWGGPIGLDVATRRPDTVAGLVVTNTWMWPRQDVYSQVSSRIIATPVVKPLFLQYNVFARVAFGVPYQVYGTFDESVYRHYMAPLAAPADRIGSWKLASALYTSRDWLERLWERRGIVAGTPALLLWGKRDPIHASFLTQWRALFPNASEVVYSGVGHFVPEEVEADLVQPVEEFLEEV